MRTSHIAIVAFLLATAYSATLGLDQKAMSSLNNRHEMRKTSFGRALYSMVELYAKQPQHGMNDLFSALDLLHKSLEEKQEEENLAYASEGKTHVAAVTKLNEKIELYTGQVTIFTQDLEVLKRNGVQLKADLDGLDAQVASASQQLEKEKVFIEAENSRFNQKSEQFIQGLDLLGRALAKLQEARSHQAAAFTNLIQANMKTYDEINVLLELSMNKLDTSKHYFMKPVVTIFSQMMNGIKPSQEQLEKVIELISGLIAIVQKDLFQLTSEHKETIDAHESIAEQLRNKISNLEKTLIPAVKSDIETNKQLQEQKGNELGEAQGYLNQETYNLEQENTAWAKRVEIHDILIPQYINEIQIVELATNVLKASFAGSNQNPENQQSTNATTVETTIETTIETTSTQEPPVVVFVQLEEQQQTLNP